MTKDWKSVETHHIQEWRRITEAVFNQDLVTINSSQCPVCADSTVRYFIHRHGNTNRGGGWVWCPACYSFEHFSGLVPDWWKNLDLVSLNKLTAPPYWLEEHWELIYPQILANMSSPKNQHCGG